MSDLNDSLGKVIFLPPAESVTTSTSISSSFLQNKRGACSSYCSPTIAWPISFGVKTLPSSSAGGHMLDAMICCCGFKFVCVLCYRIESDKNLQLFREGRNWGINSQLRVRRYPLRMPWGHNQLGP
jgi:hypothetical protein